jgi:hypothetical protein
MKLTENIECVTKSDVDCIFKCQYDFLKVMLNEGQQTYTVHEIVACLAQI